MVLVEGPADQRFLRLVQSEEYCVGSFVSLHTLPADAVEISAEVVARYGFDGNGAKQRVVAFAREVEAGGFQEGFRCVVDRDQDCRVGRDFRSDVLKYTDLGCMQLYGWSPQTLRQLIVQLQCESVVSSPSELRKLFMSINDACNVLAAMRVVSLRDAQLELSVNYADSAIAIKNAEVSLKLSVLLERSQIPKKRQAEVEEAVALALSEIRALDPLTCVNGHDLLWVLRVVLRGSSRLQRHMVQEETIAGAIVSNGVSNPGLLQWSLFADLIAWTAA